MLSKETQHTLQKLFGKSRTLTVVGASWGDEGKGKIVDLLASFFDFVARFSGGAGAGHTVVTDEGKKIVYHLIPSGVAQGKACVLGRGEFFDAARFLEEKAQMEKALGKLPPIFVDRESPLWTPWHALFEAYLEFVRGKDKINTTGKGIGPLAGLHRLRTGVLVGHLFLSEEEFTQQLSYLYNTLTPCFAKMREAGALGKDGVPTPAEVAKELRALASQIAPMITDTSLLLHKAWSEGKSMLAEGAQATGLDAQWGTYPWVSSGISVASGAAVGTGLPPSAFSDVILVTKVLPTRVGAGPFPSEIWEREAAERFPKERPELFAEGNVRSSFLESGLRKINEGGASRADVAQYFGVLGDERGATTGRGRSVGYLDIPWLQYASRINGPKGFALTRFDMLDGLKSIPVVTSYMFKGKKLSAGELPPPWALGEVKPVIEEWECWEGSVSGCTSWDNLPSGAKSFLKRFDEAVGVPALLVGTGAKRDAIVVGR
jgi:adenylosuccinate synthase